MSSVTGCEEAEADIPTEAHCARECRSNALSRYICRFSEITFPQTRADQSEPFAKTPPGPGWAEAAKEITFKESRARHCIISRPILKENSGSAGESLGPGTFPGRNPGGWACPRAVPARSLGSTHQTTSRVSPPAVENWGALVGRGRGTPPHLSSQSPSPARVGTLGSVEVSVLPEPTQAWESRAPWVSFTDVNQSPPWLPPALPPAAPPAEPAPLIRFTRRPPAMWQSQKKSDHPTWSLVSQRRGSAVFLASLLHSASCPHGDLRITLPHTPQNQEGTVSPE